MSKKRVNITVDEELYIEFATLALRKFKGQRGYIAKAIEEAIQMWVERNAQE